MALKLYMTELSPPVRAVLMVAKAIDLELKHVPLNLLRKDHLTPEYLKINPQHTVPTLVDNDGFTVWDSHAIVVYLINKYSPTSPLLPKDIKRRAVVDQRLHFDSGFLFPNSLKLANSIIFESKKSIDEEVRTNVLVAYELLEKFLENTRWVADDSLTVADFCIISTLSSLDLLITVNPSEFPKLTAWMKRMESLPEYEANRKGLNQLKRAYMAKLLDQDSERSSSFIRSHINTNVQVDA